MSGSVICELEVVRKAGARTYDNEQQLPDDSSSLSPSYFWLIKLGVGRGQLNRAGRLTLDHSHSSRFQPVESDACPCWSRGRETSERDLFAHIKRVAAIGLQALAGSHLLRVHLLYQSMRSIETNAGISR